MVESGTAGTPGGIGDRRKTVSGPFPKFEDQPYDDGSITFSPETLNYSWSPRTVTDSSDISLLASSSSNKTTVHRRSFSGSLWSKFTFLRASSDGTMPQSRGEHVETSLAPKSPRGSKSSKSIDNDRGNASSSVFPTAECATTVASKPAKTRNRKGSLRKTALLGGRKFATEGRERKNSLLQRTPSANQAATLPVLQSRPMPDFDESASLASSSPFTIAKDAAATLRKEYDYGQEGTENGNDSSWSSSAAVASARLGVVTEDNAHQGRETTSAKLASPLILNSEPVTQTSYTSTTDDDDVLTFDRPVYTFNASRRDSESPNQSPSMISSYFDSAVSSSQKSVSRRVSTKQPRSSPLSHNITNHTTFSDPEPHDYTETEYWGWIILFVTWLTFTVGMGSCLEIWSWAWDVGETPYAPPELEDDPTLPIVGYYPALIVLTGVVAWVWITVAWVGMKYFRHAKIEV